MLDDNEDECEHFGEGYDTALLEVFDPLEGWLWRDATEIINTMPPDLQRGANALMREMLRQLNEGLVEAEYVNTQKH